MNIGVTMRSHFEKVVTTLGGAAGGLATACLSNFEDLITALQVWFQAEHKEDGTHGVVTATSIAVADIMALGKLHLAQHVRYEDLNIIPTGRIDNIYVPGLETASVLKVRIAAAGVTITGISCQGRRKGDLLVVINDDLHVSGPGPDFTVTAADTNSDAANRIIGSGASASPWTVQGSEGLILMYDVYSPTGYTDFPGWRVIARC